MESEWREYNNRRYVYHNDLNERSKCHSGDDFKLKLCDHDYSYLSCSGDDGNCTGRPISKYSSESSRSDLRRNICNLYSDSNQWRYSTDVSMAGEWSEYFYRRNVYKYDIDQWSKCHSGDDIKRYVYLHDNGYFSWGGDECNNRSNTFSEHSSESKWHNLSRNICNVHANTNQRRYSTDVSMAGEWSEYFYRRNVYKYKLNEWSKCHSGDDIECYLCLYHNS
jgi:hypothetical protein